jgi:PAS domain-containing protein
MKTHQQLMAELEKSRAKREQETQQRRKAQQAFKASDAILRAVFDSTSVMMLLLDENRQVTLMNRAAEEALTVSSEESSPAPFGMLVDCVHAQSSPDGCGIGAECRTCQLRRVVAETYETGLPQAGIEIHLTSSEGQDKYFVVSTSVPEIPESRRVLVCIEDITERKRVESSLRQSEAELVAAEKIQRHLLPPGPPDVEGFDISGITEPTEFAAGDYFDYLEMPDGAIGLVVGDVSGHGVAPALLMASVSAHIRSFAVTESDISAILARTNSLLHTETAEGHFVTLIMARLLPGTHTLEYVNAGHPPAYVLDHSGDVKTRLDSTGLPLAIMPDSNFPCGDQVTLSTGDIVLFYSDGVPETHSPEDELFGTERMLQVVRDHRHETADAIIEALCDALREFRAERGQLDDVTAVVVKVEPSS